MSNTIEDADQNKGGKIQPPHDANTPFLSLPREVRQKILTKVLADAVVEDFTLMDILTYFRFELQQPTHFHPTRNHVKVPHLSEAASTLSEVRPIIKEDLPFVLNEQLMKIEGYYDNWNASGSVWEYKENSDWKARAEQWMPLMYSYLETDIKRLSRRLYRILRSIDPTDAGCWKRFKLHVSWYAATSQVPCDESDQEDEDMEIAEKLLHIDSKCDCGRAAGS